MHIGLFDSGIGGMTLLRALQQRHPDWQLTYLIDEAGFPYSQRSDADIRQRSEQNVRMLLAHGAELIVVACNTATVTSLEHLRRSFPGIPLVGTVPPVKMACSLGKGARVLVLTTEQTAQSTYLDRLVADQQGCADFEICGTTELVTAIESGKQSAVRDAVNRIFQGVPHPEQLEAVVLGCTHFPLARAAIQEAAAHPIRVFDSIGGVVRQVERLAAEVPHRHDVFLPKTGINWVSTGNSSASELQQRYEQLIS